jgi:hypothetical protein
MEAWTEAWMEAGRNARLPFRVLGYGAGDTQYLVVSS